jgi:xanthine dehydrogenase YagS FAD-binding subunit
VIAPDVLVNLKTIKDLDQVRTVNGGAHIGGLITLDTLSRNEVVRRQYAVLAEAAETVATPQIRNVGTLAGNVCQRPWCWYFRNGFPCYKNGGNTCFSFAGENQFHAIFGGGPSYIVHPSDTAVALVALDAVFRIAGPSGERVLPASQFFALPQQNPGAKMSLQRMKHWPRFSCPQREPDAQHVPHKIMDREAWTQCGCQFVQSCSKWKIKSAGALASCSAASRRFHGVCRKSSGCWPASELRTHWPQKPRIPRLRARSLSQRTGIRSL